MGQWGTRSIDRVLYCNSNGATATAAIDRFQRGNGNGATGATAIALGQWGNSNRTVLQWQWQWGATIDRVAIAAQNVDNSGCSHISHISKKIMAHDHRRCAMS
jgi:hypothetical protein